MSVDGVILGTGDDHSDDEVTRLRAEVTDLRTQLAGKADREHEHDAYARHEDMANYAPADHEHDDYVTHNEARDDIDDLLVALDDDLQELINDRDEPAEDHTVVDQAPAPLPDDDDKKRPGFFF